MSQFKSIFQINTVSNLCQLKKNVSIASLKVYLILIFFKYAFFRNQILKSHTSQSMRHIALHSVTKTVLHSIIILGQKKGTWRRTSQNWPLLRKAFSLATDDSMKFSSSNIKYPLGIILVLVWLKTECIVYRYNILLHYRSTLNTLFANKHSWGI